jgi:hypothetical protein
MSCPSASLFHIYVLIRITGEHLLYTTLAAADRACRDDEEIQEWTAIEGSDRLRKTGTWYRESRQLVREWTPS